MNTIHDVQDLDSHDEQFLGFTEDVLCHLGLRVKCIMTYQDDSQYINLNEICSECMNFQLS